MSEFEKWLDHNEFNRENDMKKGWISALEWTMRMRKENLENYGYPVFDIFNEIDKELKKLGEKNG